MSLLTTTNESAQNTSYFAVSGSGGGGGGVPYINTSGGDLGTITAGAADSFLLPIPISGVGVYNVSLRIIVNPQGNANPADFWTLFVGGNGDKEIVTLDGSTLFPGLTGTNNGIETGVNGLVNIAQTSSTALLFTVVPSSASTGTYDVQFSTAVSQKVA
jgi:hypothetical protein